MITRKPLFYWVLHRNRWLQLLVFVVIIAALFFKVYPLEMQRQIVNTAIRMGREDLLFLYCGLYFGSVIIAGILKYFLNFMQRCIGQKVIKEIRRELYDHILTLPITFFRENQPGTMINAMTSELNSVALFIGSALTTPALNFLTFASFTGYMIYLNPKLGLISMTIYPVELLLIPMLQKKYNFLNKKKVTITRAMSSTINEAVTGIHEVQGNAAYKVEKARLDVFIRRFFKVMRRLFVYKYGIKFINSMVQSVGPFILFLYGGYLAINGYFTLGALVAFLSAYEKLYDPWKEMIEYYQEYNEAAIRYRQIMETFNITPEHAMLPHHRKLFSLSGAVEVKNLDYTIPGGVKLLDNISFGIQPGQHIALVGFSGSGKSTLALTLAQMYPYAGGSIRFDKHELSSFSKFDVSKNIGFVAQHPFIFTGTIRENLLYSCTALQSVFTDAEDSVPIPDSHTLIDMTDRIGFSEDIIRLALNTVIDPVKWASLIPVFIKIRHNIAASKKAELAIYVEPYQIDTFMQHASLYENLVFGEFDSDTFKPGQIVMHEPFRDFLRDEGLFTPLLILGRSLAVQTVDLLKHFAEDDFFLKSSPIGALEFDEYTELVSRLESESTGRFEEKDICLLLNLAMRYIPAVHHIVSIPATMEDRILTTRKKFITQFGRADLNQCITMTEHIERGREPPRPDENKNKDFRPYCPTQYQFSHSLLDNIIFGNVKYVDDVDISLIIPLVIASLKKENIFDDVMGIGMDYHVGSKGDRLSGGQKQKIALARVLLKKCPVLIMDEATASLDNKSQKRVQKFISRELKEKTTVLSVIHRLDMAKDYDQIMVMRAGQIVERGTFDELMDKKGVFYDLAEL